MRGTVNVYFLKVNYVMISIICLLNRWFSVTAYVSVFVFVLSFLVNAILCFHVLVLCVLSHNKLP